MEPYKSHYPTKCNYKCIIDKGEHNVHNYIFASLKKDIHEEKGINSLSRCYFFTSLCLSFDKKKTNIMFCVGTNNCLLLLTDKMIY